MTAASNESVLLRRDEGRVAILTLNRPKAMNALSGELIDALQAEFDTLATDRAIRVVIIEARGRAFSTGHDLREVTSSKAYAFHHELITRCSAMMLSILLCGMCGQSFRPTRTTIRPSAPFFFTPS